MCGDVDPQDQLVPEHGLAQGAPDRGIDELWPPAEHGSPRSLDGLAGQAIKRQLRWVLLLGTGMLHG